MLQQCRHENLLLNSKFIKTKYTQVALTSMCRSSRSMCNFINGHFLYMTFVKFKQSFECFLNCLELRNIVFSTADSVVQSVSAFHQRFVVMKSEGQTKRNKLYSKNGKHVSVKLSQGVLHIQKSFINRVHCMEREKDKCMDLTETRSFSPGCVTIEIE